ncbi:MAG: TIGR03943 family protein [Cyanobacteria bacterium P01_D01_bin.123]
MQRRQKAVVWTRRLEAAVLLLLGGLLLYYRASGKLALLIHPNYVTLVAVAGALLAGMGVFLSVERWWRSPRQIPVESHATLLAPNFSLALLLLAIAIGFFISPQPLSSLTAMNRGAAEGLLSQQGTLDPQPFRVRFNSEERSLTDWVRTLNAYPDPEAYVGLAARVQGFVIHPGNLGDRELFLAAQFEIVCCAADARPTGLPVRWSQAQQLVADTWYDIRGAMAVEDVRGESQLVIQAERVNEIPTPASPYAY